MKKQLALTLIIAATGSACLFGAGMSPLLAPHPPAPLAEAKAPAKPLPARDAVLLAQGKILKVHSADRERGRAGWIVLLEGKNRIYITVSASAVFENAKGAKVKPSVLRPGERVRVSYRHKGKSNTALTIRT